MIATRAPGSSKAAWMVYGSTNELWLAANTAPRDGTAPRRPVTHSPQIARTTGGRQRGGNTSDAATTPATRSSANGRPNGNHNAQSSAPTHVIAEVSRRRS